MGLFTPDDQSYDESVRQTGFNRYKQLLSFHAGHWTALNLLTTVGALPLAAGITVSILTSSSLVMLLSAIVGGAIFGPFFAGMHDAIQRGLRGAPDNWWFNYKKSWKQNWKASLLPGAILGLSVGMLIFMFFLLLERQSFAGWGTIALYLFSGLTLTAVMTLYWPQLVLFDLPLIDRVRNMVLFTSKYFWKVLGASAVQIGWLALMLLFAPLTLLVIPFLGFWYVLFLSQFLLYDKLNQELNIEGLYYPDRQTETAEKDAGYDSEEDF